MGEKRQRGRTITDEHRDEARRLRALWDARRSDLLAAGVGTQEAFGARYGIGNQAAVGFFLNGKTALSLKAALGFARGLGCAVGDFSPRLATQIAGDGGGPQAVVVHASPDEVEALRAMRQCGAGAIARVRAALASGGAEFAQRFSLPALELARAFDAAPEGVKRRLYAVLLDEIRRAGAEAAPVRLIAAEPTPPLGLDRQTAPAVRRPEP